MQDEKKSIADNIRAKIAELEPLIRKAESIGLEVELGLNSKPGERQFRPTNRIHIDIIQKTIIRY